jgi:hypothetical protein
MKRIRATNLLDLLGLVDLPDRDCAGQTANVEGIYLEERKALESPRQIRPFVRRWTPLFTLQPGPRARHLATMPSRAKYDLAAMLDGAYDAIQVCAVLQDQSRYDNGLRAHRIAANILIPPPLMNAFQLASHYGVMSDLAMVRLYLDTYPALDNTLGH